MNFSVFHTSQLSRVPVPAELEKPGLDSVAKVQLCFRAEPWHCNVIILFISISS